MLAAYTAAVAFVNMIHSLIKFGLFRKLLKTLLHTVLILQSVVEAEGINPIIKDTFKIFISGLESS